MVLGTGAFGARCCAGSAHYVIPVWDYALMTEPLSAAQLAAPGLERTAAAPPT